MINMQEKVYSKDPIKKITTNNSCTCKNVYSTLIKIIELSSYKILNYINAIQEFLTYLAHDIFQTDFVKCIEEYEFLNL